MLNCTLNGIQQPINNKNFSEPVPIVGVYIASATLFCAIAMLVDLICGIRNKQYWIPSRYFSLNAVTITILGVATKLSGDLTTPMPGQLDQLTKLGTSAFLFIVLCTLMPSLQKLEKNELLANIVGLIIVVFTSVINICIQLRTGVIYLFKSIHVVFLCLIVSRMIGISIFITFWRGDTQYTYEIQHRRALRESLGDRDREKVAKERLKEYLINFTLMAHIDCPHFVYSRSILFCSYLWTSVFLSACGFFLRVCLTIIIIGPISCNSKSDYGLSVVGILLTQIISMVVALVILSVRMVSIWEAHLKVSRPKDIESLEGQYFWMHILKVFKSNLFISYIGYSYPMFIVLVKSLFLFWLVCFAILSLVSLGPAIALWKILTYLIPSVSSNSSSNDHTASTSHPDLNFIKLKPYVSCREGEERLIEMLLESAAYVTRKYITAGQKREPKHLIALLDNSMSHDFGGIVSFSRDEVPLLNPQGSPRNCWALPVVTLTSIAIALPDVDRDSIKKLIKSVKEGLRYVSIIENNFGDGHDSINIMAAANVAWAGVDLHRRWLDVDLTKLALQNRSPLKIIESLSHFAEEKFPKMMKQRVLEAIAADSMYRICQTLLWEYQNENSSLDRLNERIFEKVCLTISDIFGACFTNLKRWILLECSRSSAQTRRESAYRVLKFFGETEKIMKIVEQREIPNLSLDQMGFIDEWHAFLRSV